MIKFFLFSIFILFNTQFLYAQSVQNYKKQAKELRLSQKHYWHLLLHMNDNVSEIDDPHFFFAKDGATDPEAELQATLDAFFSDEIKDDNSSICKFPARYFWLKEQLHATDFPKAQCKEYEKIFKRVDPKSATLVFPAAHINSPASMFGHTFIRINSSYHSKLLSYAVNYAANADANKENGIVFAIKGLVGGYYGRYSLLPYYEKLKEYRDSEQRDIWEYDLNLTQEETVRMFRHIWELNGTNSFYYFFTENCSYNMLWLLEAARPTLHLRDKFFYQVIPLETVHVAKEAGIISAKHYRPSKRTKLLKYETLLDEKFNRLPIELVAGKIKANQIESNLSIAIQQKRYILESAVEYLEYQYSRGKITKDDYLERFHEITTERAKLGIGKFLNIKTPPNPIDGHRAVRAQLGFGVKEGDAVAYLGIRPAYHDLEDSEYGFLRGTQIEFMNLLASTSKKETKIEKATIVSIVSIAQRSLFFKNFSWRTKIGWDNDYLSLKPTFGLSVGAGFSWGNELGFVYVLADPIVYQNSKFHAGIGGSVGCNIDKYKDFTTNIELTQRIYDNTQEQLLIKASQGFRLSQNKQIMLKYDYKDKIVVKRKKDEQTFRIMLKCYF
ncbi:putative outermembrane protein [hydrothermal vent metagenome]|uniref:Putative outermembrane protein n=1 Tax=hydrothermal vent metagenome TaxID=652676 RepID=A0A1W1C3K4_9ZZZZ